MTAKGERMTLREEEKHQVKYQYERGLRCVEPYIFVFRCGAKGRWFKRPILEVFLSEFAAHPPDYYRESIRSGTITVNGKKVEPTYCLRNGDKVIHKTHRHEPPVTGKEVEVVAETDELLVVDKPATIPIHPCGGYRYNTLTSILTYTRPDLHLHLIYRLDRLVSGLTILAKSADMANRLSMELQAGQTQKVYLARVIGDFGKTDLFPQVPGSSGGGSRGDGGDGAQNEILFESWLDEKKKGQNLGKFDDEEEVDGGAEGGGHHKGKGRKGQEKGEAEEEEDLPLEWRVQSDGSVLVRTGIRCVSYKEGVYECARRGKAAITIIRLRSFDGETSVVECRPVTGRTHQIRLHLKWLGLPIANDPNYGDEAFVAAFTKKYRFAEKEAHKDYRYATGTQEGKASAMTGGGGGAAAAAARVGGDQQQQQQEGEDAGTEKTTAAVEEEEESEEDRIRRVCPHCAAGGLSHFREQQLRHEGIWLHALRYRGRDWAFETALPAWAQGHGAALDLVTAKPSPPPAAAVVGV